MDNWYLRNPHGLIEGEYPFSHNYEQKLGTAGVYVLAFTQDEGMKPEVIKPIVSLLLKNINSSIQGAYDIELIYEKGEQKKVSQAQLTVELEAAASNLKSPWYWDGLSAYIEQPDLKLFIQPESDGTEVAVYLTGEKSGSMYQTLVKSVDI